jgi:hypothetical protein
MRIVCFHETLSNELKQLKQIVEWCRDRFQLASPEDADALFEGRYTEQSADRLLITFDDGLESQYQAARWLADVGVRAVFFIVPSLIGRTMAEYVRFHQARGVEAHTPLSKPEARGLTLSQVREMLAMGHRIGAHNYAHRDLGKLHDPVSIHYEVASALEAVGEITGSECADFAIGFGQPENVSEAGAEFLLRTCRRVYACHRGLNVPGRTPRFLLRHAFSPAHPMAFTRVCLQGGADRHLSGRAKEMARRVGVLPAAAAEPPEIAVSRS